MILDTGICSVFRKMEIAIPGGMPRHEYKLLHQGWYGELNFETSPARPTEGRSELRTDARIRIWQNRFIRQNDVVVLRDIDSLEEREEGETVYRVNRAFHGKDDNGPTPISDLSLEVYEP